jgi:quinol-cytochrome oxidoreductase complex cytochrome b subunit
MLNSFTLDNNSTLKYNSYFNLSLNNLVNYFKNLKVSMHEIFSLFGFFTFLIIFFQIISGVMLSFSLVTEPMLIPLIRDEEDLEDLYIDDFFWLHERGVDLIFIFSYIHLFRKLYLNIFEIETESAWKSGIFSFLIFQVVVFLGLILCCTHLSEITLTIAANIFHTFFMFKGKPYWWIFTDKQLNTDTVIRLAYAHYLAAFYLAFLGVLHGIDIHYDWKNESFFDGLNIEMCWWDEALSNELTNFFFVLVIITFFFFFFFEEPEALSYEIFMWGDIGLVSDVRFYGVAPHWYFRPFMAWLIACPFHKTGIFGLIFFFFILYFQPNLHGTSEQNNYNKKILTIFLGKFKRHSFFVNSTISLESNLYHQLSFFFFIICALYTTSFLPYGRFFNRIGGNWGFLGSYFFLFFYLSFYWLRKPLFLEIYIVYLYQISCYLKIYSKKVVIWPENIY